MSEISARRRVLGWMMFDWASQPYYTLLLTFIFGPYFALVASEFFLGTGLNEEAADARAQTLWSIGLTFMGLLIAISGPILGAFADTSGRRMSWVAGFSCMVAVGAFLTWFTQPDGSNMIFALFAFGIGYIGAELSLIFNNSQLTDLTDEKDVGALSGSGLALGYVGGIVSLFAMLLFFVEQGNGKTLVGLDPAFGLNPDLKEGTRFVGPFVALWFVIFIIPYFLWVRDVPVSKKASFSTALSNLKNSIKSLPQNPSLFAYLGSSMFYRDALSGLYAFGGTYAALVLNWELTQIGIFGIVAAIGAALFSWIGGKADRKYGPKPVIKIAIWTLILVCTNLVFMDRQQYFGIPLSEGSIVPDAVFFTVGVFIGGMGGVLYGASRTMMVRHTTPENSTEAFGLFGMAGRATAFMAPALITLATAASGSARIGVSPLIFLFLVGLFLLRWVHADGDRSSWTSKN